MIKRISQVGDSLGILLPTKELTRLGIAKGTPVQIQISPDKITLVPLSRNPDPDLVARLAEKDRLDHPDFYRVLAQ